MERAIVDTCLAIDGLMRRLSSGWAALNECHHCVDIATPLADPLDPPGHPSCRIVYEDRARPLWVIEWHIPTSHHVNRLPTTTL